MAVLENKVKEEWSKQYYTGTTVDESVQANAFALGQVDILKKLQDVQIEDIVEELYGDKE